MGVSSDHPAKDPGTATLTISWHKLYWASAITTAAWKHINEHKHTRKRIKFTQISSKRISMQLNFFSQNHKEFEISIAAIHGYLKEPYGTYTSQSRTVVLGQPNTHCEPKNLQNSNPKQNFISVPINKSIAEFSLQSPNY